MYAVEEQLTLIEFIKSFLVKHAVVTSEEEVDKFYQEVVTACKYDWTDVYHPYDVWLDKIQNKLM